MIPILDLSGNVTNLIAAVNASSAPSEVKSFVTTRLLNTFPGTATARVKVFDFELVYGAVDSKQTTIEVAQIPTPL